MTATGYHHRTLVALTLACFALWAAVAGIACYAIIRLPGWVGLLMQ